MYLTMNIIENINKRILKGNNTAYAFFKIIFVAFLNEWKNVLCSRFF